VAAVRAFMRDHHAAVTVVGCLVVLVALAIGLMGKRDEFATALTAAPVWILGIAVALHLFWLLARSEAWRVCVRAAGGGVSRRRLYRASSVGYLGNIFNGNFGLAVRIAALRRTAPEDSPRASVLVAAELPVVVIEAALAAICSFTLVAPLGFPWWAPILAFAFMSAVILGMQRLARDKYEGFWSGIAVLRGLKGRSWIIALVCLAVVVQILRNWLLLNYSGVDASIFDSTALLIGLAVFGLLPIGPSLGAATAVVILGSNGVAASAAAGALLSATAVAGALCFAGWALADRLWRAQSTPQPAV
jgi:uncharacterized membrane protein YbhN (UPF0104 family)